MSKAYLALIGVLVLVALSVGGYAFYKGSLGAKPTAQVASPSPAPSQKPPSPTQPETISPKANQIALTITSPKNGTLLTSTTAKIVGKTAPNADVSVNDTDVKADASGNFTATITLDEGENFVDIVAVDSTGKVAEIELTLSYNPPSQ